MCAPLVHLEEEEDSAAHSSEVGSLERSVEEADRLHAWLAGECKQLKI